MASYVIRMKFHKNKFLTTVSAIALVLAVGACSSSDDDEMAMMMNGGDDTTNGGDDTKTPAETLADARAALVALPDDATDEAKEMAQELVDVALRLPGNEAELITSLDAKVEQAEKRQSALDLTEQDRQTNAVALQNAKDALDSASAEDKEAAQATVDGALQLPGNEAALIASLQQQVDDAAQAKKDADAATAAKEASDKAALVLLALNPDIMPTPMAPPGVMLAASSSDALTAEAAGYDMSTTTPEEIRGFRGAILTKDGAEARVYTNIENAVATPIGGIYGSSALAGEPARYSVVAEGTVSDEDQEIPWSKVTRDDSTTPVDRSGDTPVSTFAGSVRGLAGVFSCTATALEACGAPPRGTNGAVDGAFSMVGEDWTFAPTDPNGTIEIADGDPESKDGGYVQFGWWLNMKGKKVEDGFDVDTFADAPGMELSLELQSGVDGGVDGVEGSATYTGGAAGKWAIASTTEDTTEGGHFTATATLGVDFDAALPGGDDGNKDGVSFSGEITDFMTGATSRPSWNVTLTYDATPDVAGDAPTLGAQPSMSLMPMITGTSKWTTGGAVDGMGTWDARFFGAEKVTNHPTAVVGEFEAAIANGAVGRIQGAFGATN